MVIVTLPPVMSGRFNRIVSMSDIDAFRLNTGVISSLSPEEEIKALKTMLPAGKRLWIDLKCYQLRVTHWAVPTYGKIILNREIKHISLPARISFRGDDWSTITAVKGRQVFVDPPPKHAVGNGQAVNIIADELEVAGDFLLPKDEEYIRASIDQKLPPYLMLSYVQKDWQIGSVLKKYPGCTLGLKIEDMAGYALLMKMESLPKGITIVVARDDLFTNLKAQGNERMLFDVIRRAVFLDPEAIVASRLLKSLTRGGELSLGDLADYTWLKDNGVKNFMLCDSMSEEVGTIVKAAGFFREH